MKRKLCILHTIGWLGFGGLEGGVIKLVNKIDRSKFVSFVIATRGFDRYGQKSLAEDVKFLGLKKRPGRDWRLVRQLANFFSENSIDIVHSHNWDTWLYSYLAARIAGVPVFIHGEHGRDTEQVNDGWLKTKMKSFLAKRCDRLTTVSQDIAKLLIDRLGAKPERITVVPNGIDLSKFKPPSSRSAAKAKLLFRENSPVIGTVVGSFRPVKDLPTLLRAFESVRLKHSEAVLAIVGGKDNDSTGSSVGSSYDREIRQMAKNLGPAEGVVFFGPQKGIAGFMQTFDIYANSSVYEGMSNTLLEAMGCGAAIVATNVGGTPYIVRHGYNGLLVPSKSPGAMAEAISQLIASPELRNKLAENGKEYVENNHRFQSFVASHERIYQEEFSKKQIY
jgi:glycosyltransferase involved in cell wall biosynthesis